MPNIYHACKATRCPHIAEKHGYCSKHQQLYQPPKRKYPTKDSTKRGYDREWEQLAKAYLAAHPYCENCERLGVTPQPSKYAHHKIPIETDPTLRLEWDNLLGVCAICHQALHKELRGL